MATLFMRISYSPNSNIEIEKKARNLGMIYPEEIKVITELGE